MEVKYSLIYHELVIKHDIPKLSKILKTEIKNSLEKKLMFAPELFGKPLRKSLKGYWELRVRDYRVIYRIEKNNVKIFFIEHRSIVYRNVRMRYF